MQFPVFVVHAVGKLSVAKSIVASIEYIFYILGVTVDESMLHNPATCMYMDAINICNGVLTIVCSH